MKSLTRVEINLTNLIYNLTNLRKITGDSSKLLPVIKSNAYGHGLAPVASALLDESKSDLSKDIFGFGVINISEVIELREAGITKDILVLGPISYDEIDIAIDNNTTLIIYDIAFGEELSKRAMKKDKKAKVHIKVDTGLSRLSISSEEALSFIETILNLEGLNVEGLYTHLSDAEGIDQSYTLKQLIRFNDLLDNLKEKGINIPIKHMAGSAASMLLPETRFEIVRIGISLYGLWPAEETKLLMIAKGQDILKVLNDRNIQFKGVNSILSKFLRPVMEFKTTVVQIKEIMAGCSVGYGCSYTAKRLMKLAVLPIGYSEGFDRKLSNSGEVLINGKKASVVGKVCMNLTMVDITDIPGVNVGDEAVLIGRQGEEEITAEKVAEKVGTINYEIVTRINWSIPRIYIWNGKDGDI